MNKAMFSGVAGLKTHQSKMDVIGNNIANVNTYGYKSQRAVFSDVYYQTLQGATGGTASSGGTNPSSVGYGSMLSGVQMQMTTSSVQTTGYGMDVAIAGEGFIQVMDGDGNIFYTKAGMLNYDSNGYLVDINGNFVLGATGSTSDPGTQKIKLDDIGSVDAAVPSVEMTINGISYEMKASNATSYGNVSITMSSSQALPSGLKASAEISATGSISVFLNAYETFASMDEINAAVNAAILEANGGTEHAAGTFTISASENVFGSDAVNASASGSITNTPASAEISGSFLGGATISSYTPAGVVTSTTSVISVTGDSSAGYVMSMDVGGVTYTANVAGATASAITLSDGNGGTIIVTPPTGGITTDMLDAEVDGGTATVTASPSSTFLGGASFVSISSDFSESGSLNLSSVADNDDGTITVTATINGKDFTGTVSSAGGNVTFTCADADVDGNFVLSFPSFATMADNLGLADSDSATIAGNIGANLASHNANSSIRFSGYVDAEATSLTGAQIIGTAGGIDYGSLTGGAVSDLFGGIMTIKSVSSSFSGEGSITNADFFATYYAEGEGTKLDGSTCDTASWEVSMFIGTTEYRAVLADGEQANTLLLQNVNDSTDYIEISNPGFSAMDTYYSGQNGGMTPATGDKMEAFGAGSDNTITVTPSTDSENLGFGTSSFVLTGGTSGGTITLDQISNIAIGSDGSIAVSHSEKGTVIAGKISLAVFANSAGLQLMGTNYYSATANSGEAILVDPGTGGSGGLVASALEMSNVDISNEFAEMITCQRGFQANSRIITVSDTMLEELINLKR